MAATLIDEILAKNSKHAEANLVKAKLLLQKQTSTEALAILDVLIQENPRWGEAYYYKALAHFERRRQAWHRPVLRCFYRIKKGGGIYASAFSFSGSTIPPCQDDQSGNYAFRRGSGRK